MINQISLDYLKIFYEVAKQKSVSKAAKSLLLSQPAITQTLNRLEEGLQATLLIRSNKGIALTALGTKVFEHTCTIMASLNAIDTLVKEESNLTSGKLHIGCGTNIAKKLLISPIKHFLNDYPNITISVVDDSQRRFIEKMNSGEMDMCIIQKSQLIPPQIVFSKLIDETFVFVASPKLNIVKDNDLWSKKFILQQKENYSRGLFEAYCKHRGIAELSVIEVVGYNLTVELAIECVGVGMVPNYLVEEHIKKGILVQVPLILENPVMEYGFCVHSQFQSKALSAFLPYLTTLNAK